MNVDPEATGMDEKKPEPKPTPAVSVAWNTDAITEALRKAAIYAQLEREMHEKFKELTSPRSRSM